MKTRLDKIRNARGSVLLIVLGVIAVLGIGAGSYLMLMRWQHVSVMRSQAWNGSLAAAEAGIEEALAQLNPSALLFSTNIDRGANGWTLQSDGLYHAPRRYVGENYYDVAISTNTLPSIYSTGYVQIPALSATISRSIVVTTVLSTVFRGSLAARVNVDMKGNYISTDSFDAADPNYSTDGRYDVTKRKAGGDIASTDGIINVQNANVMGTLYTGPSGSYSVGSQGSVGDLGWVLGGSTGLQPGHYKNDFNLDFPDVLPPYQSGTTPSSDTISGTNYEYVLGNNDYIFTDSKGLSLKNNDVMLITGKARLYVTTDFSMQGQSSIVISSNATLELYVSGANTTIGTMNNAGNCSNFSYFGLPGNTSITLSGNDTFMGSIYAPSATLTMSGGGNNTFDYQGACSVNTISMNGHFNFHFDENLKRTGPARGYQIASWSEM